MYVPASCCIRLSNLQSCRPRNGQNFTTDDLNKAQVLALNMDPKFAAEVTTNMMGKLGIVAPSNGQPIVLSLDVFNDHGVVEHDASLTRLDSREGDTVVVRPTLVQKLLDDTLPKDSTIVNAASFARSRLRREKESIAAGSPELSTADKDVSIVEIGLLLLVAGQGGSDPASWSMKKDVIKDFFLNERFAVDLGYVRSAEVVTPERLTPITDEIKKTYVKG